MKRIIENLCPLGYMLIIVMSSVQSCQKETIVKVPTITTGAVFGIENKTAEISAAIVNDGGFQVLSKGVVWSTSPGASVDFSNKTNEGTGNSSFFSHIDGLSPITTYFVRAYATNSAGTGYGTEVTFTTTNKVAHFIVTNQLLITTSFGSPGIKITIKNDGAATGYNVSVVVNALDNLVIVDSGTAFPANLGDILPGQSAQDNAVFFKLTPSQIGALKYSVPVITWLSR